MVQGPKLTFLGRRQVATEIFFSVAIWKNVVAKKQKKSVNNPSQRNTNQNFWLPYGKFWSPIFLLRIRTKRTRLRLGLQWRFIHLPLKNHDERIECWLYTQFHKTAKCFSQLYTFSCLYLLEKKCTRLKNFRLVLCSMFKTVNDLSFRVLSRRSTDRHVVRTRPQPCSISRS